MKRLHESFPARIKKELDGRRVVRELEGEYFRRTCSFHDPCFFAFQSTPLLCRCNAQLLLVTSARILCLESRSSGCDAAEESEQLTRRN